MAKKETIRRRPQRPTRLGDPVGSVPPWVLIPNCVVIPRESQDFEQRGRVIVHGFLIRTKAGVTILDTDEIEVRGKIYQVDGAVANFGRKGLLLYVRKVS